MLCVFTFQWTQTCFNQKFTLYPSIWWFPSFQSLHVLGSSCSVLGAVFFTFSCRQCRMPQSCFWDGCAILRYQQILRITGYDLKKSMWQLSLSRKLLCFATLVFTFSQKRSCLILQLTFIHPEFGDRADRILFQHTNYPVPFINVTLRPFTRHLYPFIARFGLPLEAKRAAAAFRRMNIQHPAGAKVFIQGTCVNLILARMVRIAHAFITNVFTKDEWIRGSPKIHKQVEVS